jgi:hypothetical protein
MPKDVRKGQINARIFGREASSAWAEELNVKNVRTIDEKYLLALGRVRC